MINVQRAEHEHFLKTRAQIAKSLADAEAGQTVSYDKTSFARRIERIKPSGRKESDKDEES